MHKDLSTTTSLLRIKRTVDLKEARSGCRVHLQSVSGTETETEAEIEIEIDDGNERQPQ